MRLEIVLEAMKKDAHECNKRLNAVLRTRGEVPANAYCTNCGAPVLNRRRATCSAKCAEERKHQSKSTYRRTREWNE